MIIEYVLIYCAIVASWEFGKWISKKLIWKKAVVKVPGGKMTMETKRFGELNPQEELDGLLTNSGMHRVD